ncbi:unnamed protein product [Darwinula stevensoni]|uniref:G-protein coupled receptors family 1 profile domain-containing protein n=1 Tax=Darwinula stevensoni TaxID=69355 RepID=A0A7R9ABD7_9CRUS|nr:unnamed protein product [Darwinula stevensoni]CAG0899070.1 unnamed protein product [Darwinula stevensoni]
MGSSMDEVTGVNATREAKWHALNVSFLDNGSYTGLEPTLLDSQAVRISMIVIYSIIFFVTVFGNLLVMLVIVIHRRMRSYTNFFLANLALADFCVGVFCIYQNLTLYLLEEWVFGDLLCKIYHVMHKISTTSSVLLLVVISMERYMAIVYPIKSKRWFTLFRYRMAVVAVWTSSFLLSIPKLIYPRALTHILSDGTTETFCAPRQDNYNAKAYDTIDFILLYILPLCTLSVLYSRMSHDLWKLPPRLSNVPPDSENHETTIDCQNQSFKQNFQESLNDSCAEVSNGEVEDGLEMRELADTNPSLRGSRRDNGNRSSTILRGNRRSNIKMRYNQNSAIKLMQSRRRVIRMLLTVVIAFAVCNLPYYVRKMIFYYGSALRDGEVATAFQIFTFLAMYLNSALNPILYAFLSKNFQKSLQDMLKRKSDVPRRQGTLGTLSMTMPMRPARRSISSVIDEIELQDQFRRGTRRYV